MEVSSEVARLLRENDSLKNQLAEAGFEEGRAREFCARQTQRLINAKLWVPGQEEPLDAVMLFAQEHGEVREAN